MEFYITALTLGFITSFHCIGMCGPIAIALPLVKTSWLSRTTSALLYNSGRIITYSVLGGLGGLIGFGFKIAGVQQWVSIILGVIMILSVIFAYFFKKHLLVVNFANPITEKLKSSFGKLFNSQSYFSLFAIGLLNGLLPCGPVYYAIGLSIIGSNFVDGIIYMVLFGIGTVPIMLTISMLGNTISISLRNSIKRIVPIFIIILGIIFILRGLSLGIPYISPKSEKLEVIENAQPGEHSCH